MERVNFWYMFLGGIRELVLVGGSRVERGGVVVILEWR